jgi:hypothetical protein
MGRLLRLWRRKLVNNLMPEVLTEPAVDMMELVRRRNYLALLKRKQEIFSKNGMAAYQPHAKQDIFHRSGRFKRRYVRTGNRFGKSTMGTAEDCAWAIGERVWYGKDDPARTEGIPKRSTAGLIIVQDWDQADKIFTSQEDGQSKGKLFKMLPESAIEGIEKNQAGNINKVLVKCKWGGISSITLDTIESFKRNPMGHESADWDWIHIDEPLPEAMWTAISRGLIDRGGSAWFTCTPLTEMWINDMFVPGKLSRMEFNAPYFKSDGTLWMISGSMHDNPLLKSEDKALFIAGLTKAEIAARVEGKPKALAGQIYSEFDSEIHNYEGVPHGWEDHDVPGEDWTLRAAIDTHGSSNSSQAVLFAATGPQGHTYFFAEIYEALLIPELCDLINHKTKGRALFNVPLEPGAWIPHPSRGDCMADDFMMAGLPVEKAVKDPNRGILAAQKALKLRDPRTGEPMLRFSPSLTRFAWEIDRYVWDPKTGKPVDKNDHMMENFYRLVLSDLTWVQNQSYSKRPMKPVVVKEALLDLPSRVIASNIPLPGGMWNKRNRYRR